MCVDGEPTHDGAIHPQSEHRLTDHHGHTDQGHKQVSEGKVEEKEVLHSTHVLVAYDDKDDQAIAEQGEEEDGNVETDEYDGSWLVKGKLLLHVFSYQLQCRGFAEVISTEKQDDMISPLISIGTTKIERKSLDFNGALTCRYH